MKNPVNTEERNTIVEALNQAKLSCGAICLRFPKEMQNGAFTNPNKILRDRAIQMTKEACEWALVLGIISFFTYVLCIILIMPYYTHILIGCGFFNQLFIIIIIIIIILSFFA